jgi:hypothetical protein
MEKRNIYESFKHHNGVETKTKKKHVNGVNLDTNNDEKLREIKVIKYNINEILKRIT